MKPRSSMLTACALAAVFLTQPLRAEVIENRVFVVDGPVASSAGITAGIDLALHLIAEECGEALAAGVTGDRSRAISFPRSTAGPLNSPDTASFVAWIGVVERNPTRSFPVGARACLCSWVGPVCALAHADSNSTQTAVINK